MEEMKEVNLFILESIKKGSLKKDRAFRILKELNKNNEESLDIAIIGMAGKFPGANSVEEFWTNLTKGINSIGPIPKSRRLDMLELSDSITTDMEFVKSGYLENIDKFDASFFGITAREALLMDPAQRLLLEVAYQAMEDGNYGDKALWGTNTGVYIGIDGTHKSEYAQRFKNKEMYALTGSFSGVLASRISYTLNLSGPCMVVDTACSSSLVALHSACTALKNGECNAALVGGVNLMLSTSNMSISNLESEDGIIKVFDDGANGMVWSEGVVALLVKPLKRAIEDKDQIYGVINGSAVNNNGQANGITSLKPQAQEQVILKAWQNAKIDPASISYIEAHGSGTVFGDSIEVKAIANAFRRHTRKTKFCALGTTKTHVGHMIGASGITSIIKILLSMKYKTLPGILNFEKINQYIRMDNSPVYVHNELTDWKPENGTRIAGINSFGFNGTNCHLVLEEYCSEPEKPIDCRTQEIFLLSAQSKDVLIKYINEYICFIKREEAFVNSSVRNICYTTAMGRGHYEYRLALVVKTHDDILKKLEFVRDRGLLTDESKDIFFGLHHMVTATKEDKGENDITESQRSFLNNKAADLISDADASGFFTDTEKVKALCALYSKGAYVNWKLIYGNEGNSKIRLPVYPLRRSRFWIESKFESIDDALEEIVLDDRTTEDSINFVDYVAPTTKDEVKMVGIWQGILNLDRVGLNDNFFDIGGDSMQALLIVEKAQLEGIQIGITTVLTYRTIAEILKHVGEEVDLSQVMIPQENLDKWTLLSYANPNRIGSYLHHALPGGIILSNEQLLPWYYEHYIDLCVQVGDNGGMMLDYAEIAHTMNDDIIDRIEIPYSEIDEVSDIVGFIKKKIDEGKYVVPFFDEYYLPNKIHYNKRHFVHESLIYGYNETEKVFIGFGFKESNMLVGLFFNFDDVAKAFEMGKIYYTDDARYAAEKAVSLLSVKPLSEPLVFHPDVFLDELDNYIESKRVKGRGHEGVIERVTILVQVNEYDNDEERDPKNDHFLPAEQISYGLNTYDGIYYGLQKMQVGERIYDYRLFHVFAEHKKGLLERFNYVAEAYGLDDDFYGLIDQFRAVVDMAENARRLGLELMYLGDDAPVDDLVRVVTQVMEYMMPLRDMETQILSGIVGYLKQALGNRKE